MPVKWEQIKYYSDRQQNWPALIQHVKNDAYVIEGLDQISILGDAPKSFFRIKQYEEAVQRRRANWPAYIGKVGSKWYPIESITEQLITRMGQILGANVADSQLLFVGGQIRFLSKYFLKRDESLVHGIEILRSYLSEDFVAEIADGRRVAIAECLRLRMRYYIDAISLQ
jgi:hypothetical protein